MTRMRFPMLVLTAALCLGAGRAATASPIGITLVFEGGVDLGLAGPPGHDRDGRSRTHADLGLNSGPVRPYDVRPLSATLAWADHGLDNHPNGDQYAGGDGDASGGMVFGNGLTTDPEDGRTGSGGHDGGGLQLAEAITHGPGVDSLASDYFRIVGDLRPPPVFSTAPETPPVPEPATVVMLLGGLASLVLLRRRAPAPASVRSRS